MESRALISRTNRLSQRGVTNEQAQIVEQEISCEVQDHVRGVGSGGGGGGAGDHYPHNILARGQNGPTLLFKFLNILGENSNRRFLKSSIFCFSKSGLEQYQFASRNENLDLQKLFRLCPVLFGFYETTDVVFGTSADIDGNRRTLTDVGGLKRTLTDVG